MKKIRKYQISPTSSTLTIPHFLYVRKEKQREKKIWTLFSLDLLPFFLLQNFPYNQIIKIITIKNFEHYFLLIYSSLCWVQIFFFFFSLFPSNQNELKWISKKS